MGARLARLVAVVLGLLLLGAGSAGAVDGQISYIEPGEDGVQILVSVPPGAKVDLEAVRVSIDGEDAVATAVPAKSDNRVRRTSVLAIDTSNSMRGVRFKAAKKAALSYLDTVPEDVYVGIVSFAGAVTDALPPTLDREQARRVVADLQPSRQTLLYDAVLSAVELAGDEGQRNVLVLSDGADTSKTSLSEAASTISSSGVLVDVVVLSKSGKLADALGQLALAGGGEVISPENGALAKTFSAEADVLAEQILVTAEVPSSVTETDASIDVVLPSAAGDITASALGPVQGEGAGAPSPLVHRDGDSGFTPPAWLMYAGVGALGVGLMIALLVLVPRGAKPMSVEDRIATYSSAAHDQPAAVKPESESALTQAKESAAGMLRRNQGLEERISHRLTAAGSELKSSEWLLLHTAIFVVASMLGLLLSGGGLLLGGFFLVLGIVGPWLYLDFKKGRRRKAFEQQLPDTLQLMSGSLAAGLSLAQSVDTIVREGAEPMSGEFKRVLIEMRLGITIEEALSGITERFESKDFEWVVMAIRIQREVGGNLAELLDTVAATIREREYVRRQVAALAAEGKMSAMVLTALPPLFLLYLSFSQREYVMPLFTDMRGLIMLIGATLWLSLGAWWMSRLVKVEV